jgi:hypothetical protein
MIEKLSKFINALKNSEQKISDNLKTRKRSAFERFPVIFTMLGSFGLVATFYGFEKLIDSSDFLSSNPWLTLATGISLLVFTGSLYDRLS